MKTITTSRSCPSCEWGTNTTSSPMPEVADVAALALEVAKDLAGELGVAPGTLTAEQRAHARNLVRQRLFGPSLDGVRQAVLTAAIATQMQADTETQADAALAKHMESHQ